MASAFIISQAAQQAACDAVAALLNNGTIEVRTGAPPATPATADSGTLLGTCSFGATAFGAANTSGTATANAITSDSSADASGDAGHFRCKSSSDAVVLQGTAGEAADSADLTFDEKSIVAGGTIAISSLTLTFPSGA